MLVICCSVSPEVAKLDRYPQLVYTTQVNSAFRAIWLVPQSRDIKYYSPPLPRIIVKWQWGRNVMNNAGLTSDSCPSSKRTFSQLFEVKESGFCGQVEPSSCSSPMGIPGVDEAVNESEWGWTRVNENGWGFAIEREWLFPSSGLIGSVVSVLSSEVWKIPLRTRLIHLVIFIVSWFPQASHGSVLPW